MLMKPKMAAPIIDMAIMAPRTFQTILGPIRRAGLLTWCRVQYLCHQKRLASSEWNTERVSAPVQNTQAHSAPCQERGLGLTLDEQHLRVLAKPDQPPDARILRVAIIGTPNAGKSTLTNRLVGWRVSSVSKKVHTTRRNTLAVLTAGNVQIVFVDTPGLLSASKSKRHHLDRALVTDPAKSLDKADLIAVMVDVGNYWTRNRLDPVVLEMLHLHVHVPAVLVLNKVDAMKKKEMLLQITRGLTEGIVGGIKTKITTKKQHKKNEFNLESLFEKMEADHEHIHVRSPSSKVETVGRELNTSSSDVYIERRLETENRSTKETVSFSSEDSSEDYEKLVHSSGRTSLALSEDPSSTSTDSNTAHDRHILPLGWRSDFKVKKVTDATASCVGNEVNLAESDDRDVPTVGWRSEIMAKKVMEDGDTSWADYHRRLKSVQAAVSGKLGWPHFTRVFMLSALSGDGVDQLKEYLVSEAQPGDWDYHSSLVTDQNPYEVARVCVWEKLLEYLPQEVPYKLDPVIVMWEVDEDGILNIFIEIVTYKRKHFFMVLGYRGEIVQKIAAEAKQEMMNTFRCEVRLKLTAKLKE